MVVLFYIKTEKEKIFMSKNVHPNNILIKVIIAILLLLGCYVIGTMLFNVSRRNQENYRKSSNPYLFCISKNYVLIPILCEAA